ncbi:hypothetical protein F5X68DRAFT_218642 [Plectosphaerella plurivora]|uniref:Uncharacterized protein n=1 Tax=Plectosphaerella plurivora TaxID=936078 RepID=A0A9P8UYC0_9PEZI|nr:hypothetical protein F5X68DRAFT_218642 [Plectosphaerella plurivora]
MIARSFHHVTRTLSQLPIRSFTTSGINTGSKQLHVNELIPESLNYIGIHLAKKMKRDVEFDVPRGRAGNCVRCRFAPETYYTGALDGRLSADDKVTAHAIERMEAYDKKRDLEPLWVDVAAVEGLPVFVREQGKRKLRRALAKTLIERGIHPHGWDLKKYNKYWAAQDPFEQENHELHANREWVWQVHATLRGTLLVRITNGRALLLSGSKEIVKLADSIVDRILDKSKFPTMVSKARVRHIRIGPKPWLLPIKGNDGEPPRI